MNTKIKVTKNDIDEYSHASYAAYFEWYKQGNISLLKTVGASFKELKDKHNLRNFARHAELNYIGQLFEGDEIILTTKVEKIGTTSITFIQEIKKSNKVVSTAKITLVFVNLKDKPTKIPEKIKNKLKEFTS